MLPVILKKKWKKKKKDILVSDLVLILAVTIPGPKALWVTSQVKACVTK